MPSASTVTLRYGQTELVVGEVPRIVGTVSSTTIPKSARAICDIVELRVDLIGEGLLKFETELPILLTVRSKTEGGQWTGSEQLRLTTYQRFIPHVAAVDVELNSSIAPEVCKLAREAGKATVVSFHDFSATPKLETLQAIVDQGQKLGSIVKIVTLANTERDVEILRTLLSKRSSPLCVMGMGPHAAMTRVEFPKLGSCLTYGYLDKPLAPGQTSAAELFSQLRKMKAVILAAGKGTRMGGLTSDIPKPMLRVHGKPILEHIIAGLQSAGIREFFIVTGYRADVVEDYFGDGSKLGIKIQYGRQVVQDGTGKAPELAKSFVGADEFVLTYGDILVKPETYKHMLARYREKPASGLVTCTGSQDVTKGGLLFFDPTFCLCHLVEKPSAAQIDALRGEGYLKAGDTAWYNAGIYIFKPVVFDFTARLEKSPRGEYELTDAIIAMLTSGHRFAGLEIQGRWVDVRDPEVLASLEKSQLD